MNKFVMGVSDLVVNEYRSTILIPSMDISLLMVHDKKIEEPTLKKVGREMKRTRVDDRNSFKTRFEVQDKPMHKNRFPNKVLLQSQGSTKVRGQLVLNVEENIKASV